VNIKRAACAFRPGAFLPVGHPGRSIPPNGEGIRGWLSSRGTEPGPGMHTMPLLVPACDPFARPPRRDLNGQFIVPPDGPFAGPRPDQTVEAPDPARLEILDPPGRQVDPSVFVHRRAAHAISPR
jgi:hypothetical protein